MNKLHISYFKCIKKFVEKLFYDSASLERRLFFLITFDYERRRYLFRQRPGLNARYDAFSALFLLLSINKTEVCIYTFDLSIFVMNDELRLYVIFKLSNCCFTPTKILSKRGCDIVINIYLIYVYCMLSINSDYF